MQASTSGQNLTAASLAPASLEAMNRASDELTPFDVIDVAEMDAHKRAYIDDADAVGSMPVAAKIKGMPSVFLDKLGERLAFERTGVRLYEALILKYQTLSEQAPGAELPALVLDTEDGSGGPPEDADELLDRIRAEELQHMQLVSEAIIAVGGDPTCQTPCADVTAMASIGFMQVLNEPRTTLAQCLNVMLAVELADNAGWELLATLADDAGESDLASQFLGALAQEQEHLQIIKHWLTELVADEAQAAL